MFGPLSTIKTWKHFTQNLNEVFPWTKDGQFRLVYLSKNKDNKDKKITFENDQEMFSVFKLNQSQNKNKLRVKLEKVENADVQSKNSKSMDFTFPFIQNDIVLRRYLDFLKTKLIPPNEYFNMHQSNAQLPCKKCIGTGSLRKKKDCDYCNGQGTRPISDKWKLIMKLIENQFRNQLLDPLSNLFECADLQDSKSVS